MKCTRLFSTAVAAACSVFAAPQTNSFERREPFTGSRPVALDGASRLQAGSNIYDNSAWAGAYLGGAKFNGVTGTFTVPSIKATHGADPNGYYSASIWVGIDGVGCQTALVQSGINVSIKNGQVTYDDWYEWYPEAAHGYQQGITFSEGDVVTVTVLVTSPTTATTTIHNVSKGKTVTKDISNPKAPLCQTSAEWIVEDYYVNGKQVPLGDWGTVEFTSAQSSNPWYGWLIGDQDAVPMYIYNTSNPVHQDVATATIAGRNTIRVSHL